ncbi:hypothetical protein NE848_01275 [Gramella jeungdoensis]|uniref:Uncharacterized protein n=1 Tax=Gramella jeungdoensis TaxID=708091 RepID=A0ABT0YX13_9FLAO|nr:hypothetical protein [Gramella jeungdoensis]MCM8567995.1 hypothetical protein [Gramella jeungdoensis]
MKTKRLLIILSIVGILLLIPIIAMQFTNEIAWSFTDFLIMGILLLATGMGIELTISIVSSSKNRVIAIGAILLIFFLIWAELAVGIFGTVFAGT